MPTRQNKKWRSHGPKIPGQVNEQINSYEGGCVVNFAPFSEIPDEAGEL